MHKSQPNPVYREPIALGPQSTKAVITRCLDLGGKRIADIGCGGGALVRWLRQEGANAVGIDPNPQQIAKAQAAFGGSWLVACGDHLPLASRSLDAVIFLNSLHHVPLIAQVAALAEACRVLRSDGSLLVIEPIAAGNSFELQQPVDDETTVRAAAQAALDAVANSWFEPALDAIYETSVSYRDVEEVIAGLLAVDRAREPAIAAHRAELARRFNDLGQPTDDGRCRFDQPMAVRHLRHINNR